MGPKRCYKPLNVEQATCIHYSSFILLYIEANLPVDMPKR